MLSAICDKYCYLNVRHLPRFFDYERDRKLLIAGNSGSTADFEHIFGELMKRFKMPRSVTPEMAEKPKAIDPVPCSWRKYRLLGLESK